MKNYSTSSRIAMNLSNMYPGHGSELRVFFKPFKASTGEQVLKLFLGHGLLLVADDVPRVFHLSHSLCNGAARPLHVGLIFSVSSSSSSFKTKVSISVRRRLLCTGDDACAPRTVLEPFAVGDANNCRFIFGVFGMSSQSTSARRPSLLEATDEAAPLSQSSSSSSLKRCTPPRLEEERLRTSLSSWSSSSFVNCSIGPRTSARHRR